jgi:hypothetical protein
MKSNFLESYLDALQWLPGWCSPDAVLLFCAYNQLIQEEGIAGDVLEIGVYQGKSAIGTAALRKPGAKFVAVDLFEDLQAENVSRSGIGTGLEMKRVFLENVKRFHGETDFVRVITGSSAALRPEDLGYAFSFCHIDGGHSATETYQDLVLCSTVVMPGGLVALDDYFNVQFPGVGEGAARFFAQLPDGLRPLAIGYNKVLFQRPKADLDLRSRFADAFPSVPRSTVTMWEQPTYLFETSLSRFLDVPASRPGRLVPRTDVALCAAVEPSRNRVRLRSGQTGALAVNVLNHSSVDFDGKVALSYHVWAADGTLVQWDSGERASFAWPLRPNEEREVNLRIHPLQAPGSYQLELDIVWEGITWFKERGSETRMVELLVS